jgi:hypothetical protein
MARTMRVRDWMALGRSCSVILRRDSLRSLATRLDPHQFVRIHRSAIVNVTHVRELRVGDGTDGIAVPYRLAISADGRTAIICDPQANKGDADDAEPRLTARPRMTR